MKVKEPTTNDTCGRTGPESFSLYHALLICFLSLSIVSCGGVSDGTPPNGQSPANALDEETFELVYIALLESAEGHRALPDTSHRKFDPQPIFDQFHVDERDFRATVEIYRRDVRQWQEFYKRVIEKLEEKEKKRTAKKDTLQTPATNAPVAPS